MKTVKILIIPLVTLSIMLLQVTVSKAALLGTSFTFQGHLYDANHLANGLYDFQFKLYDDTNNIDIQVGSDINVPYVDFIDSYFKLELDLGAGVFNGNNRWLQIGVWPGALDEPDAHTILSPRHQVTPKPYALQTRGIFGDNAGNVGIGTIES